MSLIKRNMIALKCFISIFAYYFLLKSHKYWIALGNTTSSDWFWFSPHIHAASYQHSYKIPYACTQRYCKSLKNTVLLLEENISITYFSRIRADFCSFYFPIFSFKRKYKLKKSYTISHLPGLPHSPQLWDSGWFQCCKSRLCLSEVLTCPALFSLIFLFFYLIALV